MFVVFLKVRFLTVACEGKLREPLDKAARRMHTQIPTFMTDGREIKMQCF